MVHHQTHALRVSILVEIFDVKVGVGCHEVEHVELLMTEPVLPALVPSLDEHLLQAVLGCEVDVALHLGCGGTVLAVGSALRVVGLAETHRRQVVGVRPCLCAHDHVPPHAAVFRWVNPRCVLNLARLVEVERELLREHVACVVAHQHRAPRRVERSLYKALASYGVGREPRLERERLLVEVEVHRRVVETRCLVYVDVESVFGLQLQRCLHARVGEHRRRRVCLVRLAVLADHLAYARKRCNLILVLLRVVVARNPVGGVVAGHGKLRVFLLYHEVVEVLLLRKLVAQAHAVVVDAEAQTYVTIARRLVEAYLKFVVVVANGLCLAPYRCPSLVERGCLRCCFLESVHQVGLLHALRCVLVASKLQSEVRGVNHLLALVAHFIRRTSVVRERKGQAHVAVGRSDGLCRCHGRH